MLELFRIFKDLKVKSLLSIVMLCGILASCGSKENIENTDENFSAQFKSGNCGADIISDHNIVIGTCNYISSNKELEECSSIVDEFKNKYPNINCEAKRRVGLHEKIVTINESYLDEILLSIQPHKGECSENVTNDYETVLTSCMYPQYGQESECKTMLELFKSKYPEINCNVGKGNELVGDSFLITEEHIDDLIRWSQGE